MKYIQKKINEKQKERKDLMVLYKKNFEKFKEKSEFILDILDELDSIHFHYGYFITNIEFKENGDPMIYVTKGENMNSIELTALITKVSLHNSFLTFSFDLLDNGYLIEM